MGIGTNGLQTFTMNMMNANFLTSISFYNSIDNLEDIKVRFSTLAGGEDPTTNNCSMDN